MGWDIIRTDKKKTHASMSVTDAGKVVVSLSSALIRAWDGFDRFSAHMGTGDDSGKLMISPPKTAEAEDTIGIVRFKGHAILRVPGWDAATRCEQENVQVDAVADLKAIILTLPKWEVREKRAEAPPEKKPAPPPVVEGVHLPADPRGPHPEARQISRNGASLGHQPLPHQLRQTNVQTEITRKLPPSKPSSTEPTPSWRGQPDRPESKIVTRGKINMIGHIVEAGAKTMTLKGDEIKVMAMLVGADRPVADNDFGGVRNVAGVVKSIRAKMEDRHLPLVIREHNNRYAVDWKMEK